MIKLYAFTCGTVTGEFAHLMEGGEGDITVPIPVFLIEHVKGRALFDTGLHPDCQHDPAGRLGARLAGLFRIGFQPGEEVSARLEAIDRDPGEIDLIINSHFHFDHVGGNALIPNATMLGAIPVSSRNYLSGAITVAYNSPMPAHCQAQSPH